MNIDLRGAFWTPSATILGSASKVYDRILRSIFANGEQGFAYDPNDLTTLFQDTTGTIPVTSTGQPVGLVLDKSKGLKLGVELFTQFNSALNSTLSQNTLPCVVTSTVSIGVFGVAAANIFQVGVYKIEFTWAGNTSQAAMGVQLPNGNNLSLGTGVTGSFSKVMNFTSTGSFSITKSAPQVGQTFTVSAVSIKKIDGNHAYQTVSASRPILQQTPILGAEKVVNGDFSSGTSAWFPASGGTLTVNGSKALLTSTVTGITQTSQNIANLAGKTVKVSCRFSNRVGTAPALIALWSGTATTGSASSGTAREGYLEFTTTLPTPHTGTLVLQLSTGVAGNSVEFDDVSVQEITGYRTDQNYLSFDGVDDFLQTANIDFTATDKVSLFAGVRKLSDSTYAAIAELGATDNTLGSFGVGCAGQVGDSLRRTYISNMCGSSKIAHGVYVFAAPTSNVLSTRFDLAKSGAATTVMRVDSLISPKVTENTTTGGGVYGNHPLFIGRRNGSILPFSGNIYSLIGISRLTTDAETLALEKAIAKATGVTLNV